MDKNKLSFNLSGVGETALFTLYNRAIESRCEHPILIDKKAEELMDLIDPLLEENSGKMARQLRKRSIDPRLTVHFALRAKKYDDYAKAFLGKHPQAAVVNIGCGMDTRFHRIDNGQAHFFDVDLPEMITFKGRFLDENRRYHMIGQSVLDLSWMDKVAHQNKPAIFLAEGLFMFLPKEEVKHLILEMQQRFPDSELVCELTNRIWVEGFWGKLVSLKMKNRMSMREDATFQFGVDSPEELETWGEGIEFLEQWFCMDSNHPKLGMMRIFRNINLFRNAQFTARYVLNDV
jgi:methyltransferase (TIGR00027 family)